LAEKLANSIEQILKQRQEELSKKLIYSNLKNKDVIELLVFKMGEKSYALYVKELVEIIDYQSCTPLPVAKEKMIGLFSLRGDIVVAINVKELFQTEKKIIFKDLLAKFLIIQFNDIKVAILVSEIVKKVDASKDHLKQIDSYAKTDNYYLSTLSIDNQKIVVLDVHQMIRDQIESIK
jgi:purine-binding chemotaxis protein CheW